MNHGNLGTVLFVFSFWYLRVSKLVLYYPVLERWSEGVVIIEVEVFQIEKKKKSLIIDRNLPGSRSRIGSYFPIVRPRVRDIICPGEVFREN